MKKKIGIVWLREDFRLLKNEALAYASHNHDHVSLIYIFKKNDFLNTREAQRWWLYKSLCNFEKKLSKLNISLELVEDDLYENVFNKMITKNNFSLYWNRVYEPKFLTFDNKLSKLLEAKNISFKIFKGNTLNEANEIKKSDNTPYKVFTPFWKIAEKHYLEKIFVKNLIVKSLKKKINFLSSSADFKVVLPKKNWHDKFKQYWSPTEENALNIIEKFIDSDLFSYGSARDVPGIKGTSKISPYLAFGQIHVETIWEKCLKTKKKENGYRRYINELGWREFSHSLINYFPNMLKGNLRKEFDNFPWEKNKKNLQAWKKGITGYPIVDAGMRELNETGWMHNRVRMITASFLVKHLRIHWQEGEKHFRNCLLDFNAANNVAGWQWVAGCGADAAPYFRIFNPILQGEKFDPEGKYIKKWIPELKNVSDKFIHKPWEIKEEIRGLDLGEDYPLPIVDHPKARMAALKAFQKIKK